MDKLSVIKMVINMNKKNFFLATAIVLTSTSALSFEYLIGSDVNYQNKILLLGEENPNGMVEFLEFPDRAVAFEGYSEPNFQGDKKEINALNYSIESPHESKSYKIIESKAASFEDPDDLYLSLAHGCINVSYAIPSKDVKETSLGRFCQNAAGSPQRILDGEKLPNDLKRIDRVQVFFRKDNKDMIGGLNFNLGMEKMVRVSPNGLVQDAINYINYQSPNLIGLFLY